jgi:hypothetical protein
MAKKSAKVVAALTLAAAAAFGAGGSAPAMAANRDGAVNEGEFIFYYNSAQYGYGSSSDFEYAVRDLVGYKFLSSGSGKGQYVKNNAAAGWNTFNYAAARVYYNSNYGGFYDTFLANEKGNLISPLKNENASMSWVY